MTAHRKPAARRKTVATAARPRSTSPRPATGRRAILLTLAAGLAAVTFAAYAGAFAHPFIDWDDWEYVLYNGLVLGKRYGELLRVVVAGNYHPLTMLSMAWNVSTPLSSAPFVVTNVALHALDTVLVFWLTWLLSGRRLLVASFAAALFGIHPMHVESVAWISERKDVLHASGYLAAAIAYAYYLERRDPRRLLLTFVLFVAACLSKAMAVTFPVTMLLMDFWKRRPMERRSLLEKLPFFAVALLIGLIALDVQGGGDFHGLLRNGGGHASAFTNRPYSPAQRLWLPMYGYMMYVVKLLAPTPLSAMYPYPPPSQASSMPYVLGLPFFLATLAVAAWDARRGRVVAFGVGWYLVTVALVLQWLPVGSAIMADRYSYLPYVGLAFVWGMGLQRLLDTRRAAGIALGCASLVFVIAWFPLTRRQVETWRDSESVWSGVVRAFPRYDLGYVRRGQMRVHQGRLMEGMSDFRTAMGLGSRAADLYDGLGNAYHSLGQLDSSLLMHDRAVEIEPHQASYYHNRAITLMALRRPQQAIADLDRGIRLDPNAAASFYGPRGYAHKQLGHYAEAIADFDRALEAGTRDAVVTLINRGSCRLALGDRAGAAADYREALRRDPGNATAAASLKSLGPEAR